MKIQTAEEFLNFLIATEQGDVAELRRLRDEIREYCQCNNVLALVVPKKNDVWQAGGKSGRVRQTMT